MKVEPDIHHAVRLHQFGELNAAEEIYRALISIDADDFNANHLLGTLFLQQEKIGAAIKYISKALSLKPNSAEALSNLGNAYSALGEFATALEKYDRAISLKKNFVDAHVNRGNALRNLKRIHDSIRSFDAALSIQPDRSDALLGRGTSLKQIKRYAEALDDYDKAIKLSPNNYVAYNNRANTFKELKKFQQALTDFDKALYYRPEFADAWVNRGNLLKDMRRLTEARDSYARALPLKRSPNLADGQYLHTKMLLSDWNDYPALCEDLRRHVNENKTITTPFALLALPSSAREQLLCASNYTKNTHPPLGTLHTAKIYTHQKIRVAYLSADFHEHATAYLMAGLFENHDKNKFEITALSFGRPDSSPIRMRLEKAFNHFIDVAHLGDQDIAQFMADKEIDIAVDLKGFTQEARTDIFAWRGAPIQVNYLGYAGTMGAPYIDYIIADPVLIPRDMAENFQEKIAYLPDTYQVNDDHRIISPVTPTRESLGLPQDAFIFCSFNNNYKITPDVFDVWMNLLKNTDNSVLWLLETNDGAANNLHSEAKKRGVAPERIVFARKVELPVHLARQRQADIFLDTLPYNAHTSASDALWAGLPVVTCMGQTFASRVAGSLLLAIGLPELITHSLEDYQKLCLQLANNKQMLTDIRMKLSKNRATCPLFNTIKYTRNLEAAYIEMVNRQRSGLKPQNFSV